MARHIEIIVFACLFIFVQQIAGKTFGTCDLARELRRQGFPEYQLKEWICLIEAESSRRTGVRGGPNSDGSFDYGLFQINDRYWCSNDGPGKECNVRCADLLSDDITASSNCAKKIYSVHGFNAWVGWKNKCSGKQLPQPQC